MKCRHCLSELSLQMVDLGACPPSNAFNDSQDAPEKHYPLRVLVCEKCWLVQTDISLFKLNYDELFTANYPYFSSTSESFVAHAKQYVEDMFERFNLTRDSNVVEIGSNDGYLLQFVRSRCRCYGIEPTNTGNMAMAKGIRSFQGFFTEKYALALRYGCVGQRADLLVCNNVLAHVPDINDFVKGFAELLSYNGVATFEFPHLLNLVQKNQFDTIYHEHYSYLSLTAVFNIFSANGLKIFDVEKIPTHGGSLRVYAQATTNHPVSKRVIDLLDEETIAGVNTKEFYSGFQQTTDKVKNDFTGFLLQAKNMGHSVVGFGAAAKGNTLLNYAGIRSDLISYVVDETPSKQGKFLPGSRIPVQAEFTTRPDYVVIFPWNFRESIMDKLSYIRDWGGKFVFAIPHLEIA